MEQRFRLANPAEGHSRLIAAVGAISGPALMGFAPEPHDSRAMRGSSATDGGRRSRRHVLYQAALASAYHDPVPKPVAKRLRERGKPHSLVFIAIARRLVTLANATIKPGTPSQPQPRKQAQVPLA
ncbi:MAG: hypothetical protein L0H65_09275 [Pseudorhodobacter sp.]|nr:hypothetical protein [Pseudorhodobacter sp.]